MPETSNARQALRRIIPRPVRAALLRAAGRAPIPAKPAGISAKPAGIRKSPAGGPTRLGPNEPGGIARLHVGCGPQNLMADWWNVDIRAFKGVDEVADVTAAWPWASLDYVYGEHFLEHLPLDGAVAFLGQALARLRPGGRIRLSTPGLEWVWQTHLRPGGSDEQVVADTYRANRAFHGWGHEFLYSRPFLKRILDRQGFVDITFHAYGESDDPALRGLERHGTYQVVDGWPNVWNVEAARPSGDTSTTDQPETPLELLEEIEREFGRYVSSGH